MLSARTCSSPPMPRKREVAWDPSLFPQKFERREGELDRHVSPTGALMASAPGHDPGVTQEELLPLREVIVSSIGAVLSERERRVFDALFIERLPLRAVGNQLGLSKSQVARVRDAATRKLREDLKDHPLVRPLLKDEDE